ncbi:hypothetical protein [Metabacillus malikii]|uniref:N-acetyltransferase domain-containing protein n=1 Tax=Metabacillus malikii TaxID=1504265 RepID=A0ABT9ZDH1_9BACI|nr:hypothetical protein [Metabacillus malikii]MDQ0230321.1 hypothetical protein [Metabacillus malikii]
MTLKIIECKSDANYEKYATFFLKYRKDIYPLEDVQTIVTLMCDIYLRSHIFLLFDKQMNTVGSVTYSFEHDQNEMIIEQALLHPDYRGTMTFIRCMREIIDKAIKSMPTIQTITFHAEVNNPYINRMYSKFAKKGPTIDVFGVKRNLYTLDKNQFKQLQAKYAI